jgi:pimeloyl-ACP methyl ester carboxylesterase
VPTAKLKSGAELAYDEFDFGPPWERRDPLVLVHGFTKNRAFWFEWIPELARRFRVLNVDVRGHNESSGVEPGFAMSLTPFSDDLAEFLDALSIERAHFVMAEFSSAVGIDLAVRYPERIKSLTLAGFTYDLKGSAVPWDDWIRLLEEKGTEAWARTTNHTRLPESADPALRSWYIAQQSRIPADFLVDVFRYIKGLDLSDRLPDVKVPTMILAGDRAVQAPIAAVRHAAEVMPDCRLVVLKGKPFNVMSSAPEACVDATLRFIESVRAREPQAAPSATRSAAPQRLSTIRAARIRLQRFRSY